jgi:aminopeptidase C
MMTDEWFDQYVYQIVVGESDAPKSLLEILKRGSPTVLPPWDPM